jgi:Transposase IS66 family
MCCDDAADPVRFASRPDLDIFTNNEAERTIRPVKVQQRSSGGCWRTLRGLADFATVQSYLSTAAKWGISKLDALRNLLLPACLSGHRLMINGNAHWRQLAFRPRTLPRAIYVLTAVSVWPGAATRRFRGPSRSMTRRAGPRPPGPRGTLNLTR